MSFQKTKSDRFCVGGRYRSSTVKNYGDITSKVSKVLIGYCSICKGKKSLTVSDNTIIAEGLGDFFKKFGKISAEASKKLATNALKNPARFPEIGANVAAATANRNSKAALSALPEVINFYHTGKDLYFGNFVFIKKNQKTDRFYPSAPFENTNIDLEQRLEEKVNDVNSFNNHIKNMVVCNQFILQR